MARALAAISCAVKKGAWNPSSTRRHLHSIVFISLFEPFYWLFLRISIGFFVINWNIYFSICYFLAVATNCRKRITFPSISCPLTFFLLLIYYLTCCGLWCCSHHQRTYIIVLLIINSLIAILIIIKITKFILFLINLKDI
jgi:hypothetical protein